ncbi:metal-dependent hydrolase [Undibacterium parvum]|uniref:Metal-dependent hydrolase n=1 Tax=Undibacterium parvum TaxID=401471 RepID=A0A3S9HN08_9BURK|nr:metal-dependent hydrolase [Undibacterium parvum]AZP13502.1 metal-dependent hydrolase [Undibacterium parvum]
MSDLIVRRLLIDMKSPIASRWNGGDAFRSAFFNALSMSFPVGEQYFIDSVRNGLKSLREPERERFDAEVRGFIGQEATHRRLHTLFNGHLDKLGYTNEIEARAIKRIKANAAYNLRAHVAATAATEHFTALFADWILRHPEALADTEPRLQTLWQWHCAEESEHRNAAFDIYVAMGGEHAWRIRAFYYISLIFMMDLTRQTLRNLWHDSSLFSFSTWRSAAKFLFAKDGLIRGNIGLWRDYLSPDFHPSQHESSLSQQWLIANATQFAVVGQVEPAK